MVVNMDGVVIVHHVNWAGLEQLFKAVAKPVPHHGGIDWIAPGWWYVMDAYRVINKNHGA